MLKNLIVFPDGTELFSGAGTEYALQSVTLTQQVNAGTELTFGSACANMLEATLITPEGGFCVSPGAKLVLYKVEEDGTRKKMGIFVVEKADRPSANRYKITAYDKISWLDKDLSDWLERLDGWPYTLLDFAHMVCAACNLTLVGDEIPNGDWQIQKFSARDITGRQLMQWIGQICGRFVRATVDGEIELAWYTPREISLTPDGELPVVTCRLADYRIVRIDKVQIRLTEKDVGAVYGTGSNAYCITGNYLLATDALEPLQTVAQTLYNILQEVNYVPGLVKIPANGEIWPGDIIRITDRNGLTVPFYVMKKVQTGPWETLECTGNAYRNSSTVTNNAKMTALSGNVMELQVSMEGLRAENRSADGRMTALELNVEGLRAENSRADGQIASLELSVEGLRAENRSADDRTATLEMTVAGLKTNVESYNTGVQGISSRMTTLEQNAAGLTVQVQNVKTNGVSKVNTATGYTFDETGMTVVKNGREIKTQISEDGMQVFKNEKVVLTANSEGVEAVDLYASTYLLVGGRSRFENYGADRTGCFWIGG